MAVSVTRAPQLRFMYSAAMEPWNGLWTLAIESVGDAGGGNHNLNCVPGSPVERIFRLDGMSATWGVVASAAALTTVFRIHNLVQDEGNTFERVSSNGAVAGTHIATLHQPYYWNSVNQNEQFLQFSNPNLNTQTWIFRAWGVFHEPIAEERFLKPIDNPLRMVGVVAKPGEFRRDFRAL